MTNLDNLITRANNVLGALEGLIEGDAAETPIVDTSVPYDFPAIAFDEANDAWTLMQDTADSADGLYKGVFLLALETGCAVLTVVSHNVTTPGDGIPARYQACGAGSLTNVNNMTTLNNKQIDKLEIRSTAPFEVKVKLTTTWCYEFDFTQDDGEWVRTAFGGNDNGNWLSGSGWQLSDFFNTVANPDNAQRMVFIERTISTLTQITSISMTYNLTKGTYHGSPVNAVLIFINDNIVSSLSNVTATDGTDLELGWTGTVNEPTLLRLYVRSSSDITAPYAYSGSGVIKSVVIRGVGVNPFGTNSC